MLSSPERPIAAAGERMGIMMPLTLAEIGKETTIRRIGGSKQVKGHLEDLGFVPGGTVTVLSDLGGNVIVRVKESRLAIGREMAVRILVD